MSLPRELSAKFFAVIVEEGGLKFSFHFKEHEGHLLVAIDDNMLELAVRGIIEARKERKASAEIPAL